MATLADRIDQLKGLNLERAVGLRPEIPRVAVELGRAAMVMVRLKKKRRGRPVIENYGVHALDGAVVPATISEPEAHGQVQLDETLRKLFDQVGVRPGKISLVLPDNLAKLALLHLPERPPSRRQLEEVIRFKTRRGVPFRLSDATISYQVLPGEGKGLSILVAVMRRTLVERFEHTLEALGARPGLVDLCTPNLLNLCRDRIDEASGEGDVALLNCAGHYFSLAIVRQGRLVFLRCKTYSMGNGAPGPIHALLARELSYSRSYYEEKLAGKGMGTLLVRSLQEPFDELSPHLGGLEADQVEMIDPLAGVDAGDGGAIDPELAQRLGPALGAVLGRS